MNIIIEDQNEDQNHKEDLNYILLEKSNDIYNSVNESKINELVDCFYDCNLFSQKKLLYKYINNVIETNNKNSELLNEICNLNEKINDITISNIAIVNNYKKKLELLSQNTLNVSKLKKNHLLFNFSTLLCSSAIAVYSVYYLSKKS